MSKNKGKTWFENQFMSSESYELHRFFDKRPSPSPLHAHEYYELYYFMRGNILFTVEKGRYKLLNGDVLLLSPSNLHKVEAVSQSGYERTVLRIDSKYLESLSTDKTDLAYCFKKCSERGHLIRDEHISHEVDNRLQLLFEENEGGFGEDVLREMHVKTILLLLARYMRHEKNAKENASFERNGDIVTRTIEYINENLSGDLSLDILSDELYISKYHLARLFKKETGTTPHQYILKKRLLLSKNLIKSGYKVREVYSLSGFNDYTHYFRAFKSEFGVTPKKYYEMKIKNGG